MKKYIFFLVLAFCSYYMKAQTANIVVTQSPCNADGILTASFSGVTLPLTIQWYSSGSPVVTHTNVNAFTDVLNNYTGAYVYLSGTDANNVTFFGVLQGGAPPFQFYTTTTPAQCPNPGSINTVVTGGTPPYAFEYINLQSNMIVSTSNPASVPAGEYEVMITDAMGCKFGSHYTFDSIIVYTNNTFVLNTSMNPAGCTNGSVTINSVTGGTTPYTYVWSNAATGNAITGLSAGTYIATITDGSGCSEDHNFYVPQNPTISVQITSAPSTCLNNDGSATAFGVGGTPPYTYLWSNAATTSTITNLAAGYYPVTATDVNGCTGSSAAYINSSTPIVVTSSTTSSLCTAPTGSANLTISGGNPPYTTTWNTFPPQTGNSLSNVAPGNYAFSTVDINGCIQTGSVTIPPVSIISATLTTTPASCTQSNGAINTTINSGTPPYTYIWSTTGTGPSLTGIPAGNYYVTVVDNFSCSKQFYASVISNSPVQIGLTPTPASCIYSNDGMLAATATGGTAPYVWQGGSSTLTNLNTDYYTMSVTDANGCTNSANSFVGYNSTNNSCFCTLEGTVYHDANSNCIMDAGEQGIPNIQIHCVGFGFVYTDANGYYSFHVPSGNYTLMESVLGMYPLSACQNNNISVNVVASSGCTQTNNFGNAINPIHDMKINTWNYAFPIPGFPSTQEIIITNMGTITENAAQSGYLHDGQLATPSFSPVTPFSLGGPNWYSTLASSSAINLAPGASSNFYINYLTPTNIPLGTGIIARDTVAYMGPMSNWLNDYSPWDNVNYFTTTVIGSYDPNFKEVYPKGIGSNGNIERKDSVLDYMVHFQNLGNYQAQNVIVLDTLDADLDWTTLRPVYKSHNCNVSISDNGVAKFEFLNIVLPAKMYDEAGSQGMFSYTIKTKKNLPLGTQFKNKAAIYFDFNEPVITNTTVNTLVAPAGTKDLDHNNSMLSVYPNPGYDEVTLQFNSTNKSQTATIQLYDLSGKLLFSQVYSLKANEEFIKLNTSSLIPGLYFISADNGIQKLSTKFIKLK